MKVANALLEHCEGISTALLSVLGEDKAAQRRKADGADGECDHEALRDRLTVAQPACMVSQPALKGYQLIGLNWLAVLHKQNVNAVLADEMGLGKTVQSISFLAHLFEQQQGPFVVVVPSSVMDNWKREFGKWCPCLEVLELAGPAAQRRALYSAIRHREVSFDVCLVSYTVAMSTDDKKFLTRQKFACAVFDEGHMLKNMKSKRYQTLMKIRAERRVLLTGTPLQNNLMELISLVSFIMPHIFTGPGTVEVVRRMFNRNHDGEAGSSMIAKVKRIISPFLLRRLKTKVLDIPDKLIKTVPCVMTETQQRLYDSIVAEYKRQAGKAAIADERESADLVCVASSSASACMSVVLAAGPPGTALPPSTVCPSLQGMACCAVRRANEPQSLTNTAKRHAARPPSLDGPGGGERKRLYNLLMQLRKAANHPLLHRQIYTDDQLRTMSKLVLQDAKYAECNPQLVYEDFGVMTDYELMLFCDGVRALRDYRHEYDVLEDCGKVKTLLRMLHEQGEKGQRVLVFSQFTTVLDLLGAVLKRKGFRFLRLDGSTPVADRQPMLDEFTGDEGIPVFLLSTRVCCALPLLFSCPACFTLAAAWPLLLATDLVLCAFAKAGGLGINLIAANVVIIYDIDFNPWNDKQAEDRCHRVGQTKPVEVYRFVSKGSVEELMDARVRTVPAIVFCHRVLSTVSVAHPGWQPFKILLMPCLP